MKCDEAQPICGACSLRGDRCSFPSNTVSSHKVSRRAKTGARRGEATENDCGRDHSHERIGQLSSSAQIGASMFSDKEAAVSESLRPLEFGVSLSTAHSGALNMTDLKLLHFFLMHTSKKMSLVPKRRLVWERVIPELGMESQFLMHLVLALAGIHIFSEQLSVSQRNSSMDQIDSSSSLDVTSARKFGAVDLHLIIWHHQRGLKGFRKDLALLASSNQEALFIGSSLLATFALASLRVRDFDLCSSILDSPAPTVPPHENCLTPNQPRLDWLRLFRGASSVVKEQWLTLRASRLRQMVIFPYAEDYWKTKVSIPASYPRLEHCSQRLNLFVKGAAQALSCLKSFVESLKSQDPTASHNIDTSTPPTNPGDFDRQRLMGALMSAWGVLESKYMRILDVLQFPPSEQECAADVDAQADIEDTAAFSWPHELTNEYIYFLDLPGEADVGRAIALTFLAHLYLIFTLFEELWYLQGGFEREILKINELVLSFGNTQLASLMLWPLQVIKS